MCSRCILHPQPTRKSKYRRDWLGSLPVNLFATCNQLKWTDLYQKFSELFNLVLEALKNVTAKLYVKQNSTPRYIKAKSVPLTIRKKVKTEFDGMVASSVTKSVDFLEWTTPIIPVLKRNGHVQICVFGIP